MKKTTQKKDACIKLTSAIAKAFGLKHLMAAKRKPLCLYVEIYDEDGKLIYSGCMDNGCKKVPGWCEQRGGKKCHCNAYG